MTVGSGERWVNQGFYFGLAWHYLLIMRHEKNLSRSLGYFYNGSATRAGSTRKGSLHSPHISIQLCFKWSFSKDLFLTVNGHEYRFSDFHRSLSIRDESFFWPEGFHLRCLCVGSGQGENRNHEDEMFHMTLPCNLTMIGHYNENWPSP